MAEYYSPRAKQRWCLALYSNAGHHTAGVLPQATTHAWHCDICGAKSGRRGFEATFDILPRLNVVKFDGGVIDELLFLDLPREIRFASGLMMLEYTKAVQECVYEQLRVVREGQLRIVFTRDLKIFSWDFCVRRHEELLPRKLVAPQVNQLVQVAQKCQSTISESGSDGVSQHDLQSNSNMVLTAGRQLAKSLELQSLNDLGFSKRFVRTLQISEVCNNMKESITVKDRLYKMHRFTNCFLGSDALDFLSEDQYLEKPEAVEFARKLASKLFFRHVLDENLFEDGNHVYRFLDDDPTVVAQCHNISRGIITFKPKPISEIASRLRVLASAMFEAYAFEDGCRVDYTSLHGCQAFASRSCSSR